MIVRVPPSPPIPLAAAVFAILNCTACQRHHEALQVRAPLARNGRKHAQRTGAGVLVVVDKGFDGDVSVNYVSSLPRFLPIQNSDNNKSNNKNNQRGVPTFEYLLVCWRRQDMPLATRVSLGSLRSVPFLSCCSLSFALSQIQASVTNIVRDSLRRSKPFPLCPNGQNTRVLISLGCFSSFFPLRTFGCALLPSLLLFFFLCVSTL